MLNYDDFFNKCFSPNWLDIEDIVVEPQEAIIVDSVGEKESINKICPQLNRKSVAELEEELAQIEESIQNLCAKEWHLANLKRFISGSFSKE